MAFNWRQAFRGGLAALAGQRATERQQAAVDLEEALRQRAAQEAEGRMRLQAQLQGELAEAARAFEAEQGEKQRQAALNILLKQQEFQQQSPEWQRAQSDLDLMKTPVASHPMARAIGQERTRREGAAEDAQRASRWARALRTYGFGVKAPAMRAQMTQAGKPEAEIAAATAGYKRSLPQIPAPASQPGPLNREEGMALLQQQLPQMTLRDLSIAQTILGMLPPRQYEVPFGDMSIPLPPAQAADALLGQGRLAQGLLEQRGQDEWRGLQASNMGTRAGLEERRVKVLEAHPPNEPRAKEPPAFESMKPQEQTAFLAKSVGIPDKAAWAGPDAILNAWINTNGANPEAAYRALKGLTNAGPPKGWADYTNQLALAGNAAVLGWTRGQRRKLTPKELRAKWNSDMAKAKAKHVPEKGGGDLGALGALLGSALLSNAPAPPQ